MANAKIEIVKAETILKAYAEDPKGLTSEECRDAGFNKTACKTLTQVLQPGKAGVITPEERDLMDRARFSKDFINVIAGSDGKTALRRRAEWLAGQINLRWLRHNYSWKEREKMVEELGEIGIATPQILSALFELLKDQTDASVYGDSIMRGVPSDALGKMGKPAIPGLVALLDDERPGVAEFSVYALGGIGRDAPEEVIPVLINGLAHKNPRVRVAAGHVIWRNNLPAKTALPALIRAASDKDPDVRYQAISALSNKDFQTGDVLPLFIKALQEGDENLKQQAAVILRTRGAEAAVREKAKPALIHELGQCPSDHSCLDCVPVNVCEDFLKALRSMVPEDEMIETFLALLPGFRDRATLHYAWEDVVSKMGPSVVSALVGALADQNPRVRRILVRTLRKMGRNAEPAIPILYAMSETDPDPVVRAEIVNTLEKLKEEIR